jgi:hypothetical protein
LLILARPYGFRKNERTNINNDELRALQEIAKVHLGEMHEKALGLHGAGLIS